MADNLNIIERANKILTFRKYVREECRKKDLEYPSDEKIAEWISQEHGWSVEDFMKDYTEKKGIFRDPFEDFKAAILAKGWTTPPTDEEIRSYVAENGYKEKGFIRWHNINGYEGVEKAILIETLKLKPSVLATLWNTFIEESHAYGEDSYIYNLADKSDIDFLRVHMRPQEFARVRAIMNANVQFLQWFSLNDGKIVGRSADDVKDTIAIFWDEILERIIVLPKAYNITIEKQPNYELNYFDDVVWLYMAEKCGYKIDQSHGTMTKI